jgi:hypothetical protein
MAVPVMAAAQHIKLPPPPAPDAPGPFSFADETRVRGILGGAGFVGVEFESINQPLTIGGGGSLDEAVDFLLQMGPAAAALREAGADAMARVRPAVRDALSPYYGKDGVRMDSASWIVTAASGPQ